MHQQDGSHTKGGSHGPIKDPAMIPNARITPAARPSRIDVPAMPRVAGPGLAEAMKLALSIRGQFSSYMIVIEDGRPMKS